MTGVYALRGRSVCRVTADPASITVRRAQMNDAREIAWLVRRSYAAREGASLGTLRRADDEAPESHFDLMHRKELRSWRGRIAEVWQGNRFVLVAQKGKEIVGVVSAGHENDDPPGTARLLWLREDPDFPDHGIASTLLNECLAGLKDKNFSTVITEVLGARDEDDQFWSDSGFKRYPGRTNLSRSYALNLDKWQAPGPSIIDDPGRTRDSGEMLM